MRIDESDLADCPISHANLDVGDAIYFHIKLPINLALTYREDLELQ